MILIKNIGQFNRLDLSKVNTSLINIQRQGISTRDINKIKLACEEHNITAKVITY